MSDHADKSDGRIAQIVEQGMDRVGRAAMMQPTGHCRFCDEELAAGLLFCDVDCRDDFEKEDAAMKRAGR